MIYWKWYFFIYDIHFAYEYLNIGVKLIFFLPIPPPQKKNFQRTKRPKGQNVPRTKRPKDKTSQGQNVSRAMANYLIQYGQDKGMA